MNEKQFKKGAHWIYRRRSGPDWWTHLVLTSFNSDPSQPDFTEQEARRIFEVLERKELITRDGEITGGGITLPRYKFNFAKLPEWKKEVRWVDRVLPSWLVLLFLAWKKVFIFCVLIILTAFLEDFAARLGDVVWTKILPSIEAKEEPNNRPEGTDGKCPPSKHSQPPSVHHP